VEQWIALKRLDMLRSLCNCCVFKVFDFILAPECRMCVIRKGIVCIANEGKKDISDCGEMQTPVEQPKGRLEGGVSITALIQML